MCDNIEENSELKRGFNALSSNCVPVRPSCDPRSSGTELRTVSKDNNCKNVNSVCSNIDFDNDNKSNKNGNNVRNNRNNIMSKDSDVGNCNTTDEENSGRPIVFVLIDRSGERFRTKNERYE